MVEDAVWVHQKLNILGLIIVTHKFCSEKDMDLWSSLGALRPLLSFLLHPALLHVSLPEAITGQTLGSEDRGAPASLSGTGCPVLPCYRAHYTALGHCSQFSWLDPWNDWKHRSWHRQGTAVPLRGLSVAATDKFLQRNEACNITHQDEPLAFGLLCCRVLDEVKVCQICR